MRNSKGILPEYENPPLIEAILGVQFNRIAKFRNAHLGAFWSTLKQEEWPNTADAPLLSPQFETFRPGANWAKGMRFQLTQDPAYRLQITNVGGDRMIQVQNDRLHLNWLGKSGGSYPRYTSIREEFSNLLKQFVDFVATMQLGGFQPNQWEVTYVNHIPQGTVWQTPSDWIFFKPIASVAGLRELVQEESIGGEWHYVIPPNLGRLHIEWQNCVELIESDGTGREFIRLTLTSRGPIDKVGDSTNSLLSGFDRGHEVIVRSFEKLMSDNANEYWGLK